MSSILTNVLALIVTLGVLIAFHEFGHFWVARRLGVKVLRFSIGFGKPLISKTHGADKTEYVLAAIPLGGYVKMLDEREGEVAEHERHRAFNRQSVATRFAIVSAGPIFNFIFAIIAYFIMYVSGVPGMKPFVGDVKPDTPAYTAGIQSGDEIISVDGTRTKTWNRARISLLDASLDQTSVNLVVQQDGDMQREVSIRVGNIETEEKQKNLLKILGLTPFSPKVEAVIGKLQEDGAAKRDGLLSGDKVITANGKTIDQWIDWVKIIRSNANKTLEIDIERNGVLHSIELTPKEYQDGDEIIGRIGASPLIPKGLYERLQIVVQYPVGQALVESVAQTWQISIMTLRMIGKMLVGEVSVKNLSGPITIATYAGYTASAGFSTFLSFLAIVSISLGVLNLLPIPMLDGGHLLQYVIEIIKGQPLSEAIQIKMQTVGIAILGMLMVLALYNDLFRLFGS